LIRTLAELPEHVARRYPREVFLRRCRPDGFETWSTRAFVDRVRRLAAGFVRLGIEAGDRVVLMSESRPEWVMCDLAILSIGGSTVPIYPTLSPAQARYILEDCGARIAIVSDAAQARKIQEVRHLLTALEALIAIEPSATGASSSSSGGSILDLGEVETRGGAWLAADSGAPEALDAATAAVVPSQLATIIYTSGTTGEPKGVMLTHHNIVSNVHAVQPVLRKGPDDVALSFLPLSHSFERTVVFSYLSDGVTLVFAENIDSLPRDLPKTAPTLMTAVPRVFEKLHTRILDTVEQGPAFRRTIFSWAVSRGLARVRAAQRNGDSFTPRGWRDKLADRLVFSKIRARMGGRMKTLVSGSAPLQRDIAEFFAAAGLPILEGYGLTETSPVLTANRPEAPRFGTVGQAVEGVELRIAEDGEILARGPNIMRGYWRKPEATAEALDDGWFHTGDIGVLSADGYLTITDRKKDVLVTSGGKKVAPQPIERRLAGHPLVAEAVLVGDGRRFPSVLIVPAFAVLEQRLRALGRASGDRASLVARADVVGLYQEIVDALNHELAQYEQIKKMALLPTEFTIDGGELTPTLKVKRRVVESQWREVIEGLYA
jgi:long-chain acyl-CoA synthetase